MCRVCTISRELERVEEILSDLRYENYDVISQYDEILEHKESLIKELRNLGEEYYE